MIDQEQQRDYGEEAYLRAYCPECGGPCSAPDDESHTT